MEKMLMIPKEKTFHLSNQQIKKEIIELFTDKNK